MVDGVGSYSWHWHNLTVIYSSPRHSGYVRFNIYPVWRGNTGVITCVSHPLAPAARENLTTIKYRNTVMLMQNANSNICPTNLEILFCWGIKRYIFFIPLFFPPLILASSHLDVHTWIKITSNDKKKMCWVWINEWWIWCLRGTDIFPEMECLKWASIINWQEAEERLKKKGMADGDKEKGKVAKKKKKNSATAVLWMKC